MKTTVAALATVFLCWSGQCHALTGNDFYQGCRTDDGVITGYVAGIIDRRQSLIDWFLVRLKNTPSQDISRIIGDDMIHVGGNICVPAGSSVGQSKDIVCKYLVDHPEVRHLGADGLVIKALEDAWPCN